MSSEEPIFPSEKGSDTVRKISFTVYNLYLYETFDDVPVLTDGATSLWRIVVLVLVIVFGI